MAVGYHRAMATLSRSDVEHVAHLARLGLTDDELSRLEGQLNHILDQYAILAELATDAHPADGPDDRAREHPARRRRAAVAAGSRPCSPTRPARDGDFIVVPAILDER